MDTDKRAVEFRPCPFCASPDNFSERSGLSSAYVVCNDCGAHGPDEYQESDDEEMPGADAAYKAWNNRALSAPVAQPDVLPFPPADSEMDWAEYLEGRIKALWDSSRQRKSTHPGPLVLKLSMAQVLADHIRALRIRLLAGSERAHSVPPMEFVVNATMRTTEAATAPLPEDNLRERVKTWLAYYAERDGQMAAKDKVIEDLCVTIDKIRSQSARKPVDRENGGNEALASQMAEKLARETLYDDERATTPISMADVLTEQVSNPRNYLNPEHAGEQTARMPVVTSPEEIANVLWEARCKYHVKYGFKETDEYFEPRMRLEQAKALISAGMIAEPVVTREHLEKMLWSETTWELNKLIDAIMALINGSAG